MKILLFIGGLLSGGKERQFVEFVKLLKNKTDFELQIVLTKKYIHYKMIELFDIPIILLERKKKKDPSIFIDFFKICTRFKPDVIHVWDNLTAVYAIPTKLLLQIPLVNYQVQNAPLKLKKNLINHYTTFFFSDIIIGNSNAGLKAYNAPIYKSKVIYNGFDFDRIINLSDINSLKEKLGISLKTKIVGMVASFSKLKDYKTYISAANIVLKTIPETRFLCIGSGDKHEYKKIVNSEFENKVLFLEAQEDIESYMNICDVGVLATYTEGISNTILEFMALEKPVVATDGGGTCEVIDDGVNGYLVPQKSAISLADKIIMLLQDSKLREKLGKNGKLKIMNKFSNENLLNNFLDIYSKILKKSL